MKKTQKSSNETRNSARRPCGERGTSAGRTSARRNREQPVNPGNLVLAQLFSSQAPIILFASGAFRELAPDLKNVTLAIKGRDGKIDGIYLVGCGFPTTITEKSSRRQFLRVNDFIKTTMSSDRKGSE